jgi:hypothetical protein
MWRGFVRGYRPSVERTLVGRRLLWGACAAGLVHAGFSLYWALGGRWLIDTVGKGAVQLVDRAPVATGLALLAVAAVKVAGATIPLLVEADRLRWPRFWRAPALEQVLLPSAARRDTRRRTTGRPLVLEQPLEPADRRRERRAHRSVLGLAVPAAVRELLAEQPGHDAVDVHSEVDADRDGPPVDARLDHFGTSSRVRHLRQSRASVAGPDSGSSGRCGHLRGPSHERSWPRAQGDMNKCHLLVLWCRAMARHRPTSTDNVATPRHRLGHRDRRWSRHPQPRGAAAR